MHNQERTAIQQTEDRRRALGLALVALGLAFLGCRHGSEPPTDSTRTMEPEMTADTTPSGGPGASRTPASTGHGWTEVLDPLSGEDYLSPPPDDDAAIQAAFNALLACALIKNRSDEEALAYDWESALTEAQPHVERDVLDYFRHLGRVELTELGPLNEPRCESHTSCVVAQAKLGSPGIVIHHVEHCARLGFDAPCVVRPSTATYYGDETPYAVFIATVELQWDGAWHVSDLDITPIAAPPAPD